MIRAMLSLSLLALAAACADRTGTDGSENDFANRVGAGKATTAAAGPGPLATAAVKGPPPSGANVFALEKLGDIAGVDLGPRAGSCTFSSAGNEMLVAAGPADRSLPGKGVVRIGGKLIALDTPPGGIEAVKTGTTFTGEGFTVRIQPSGKGKGSMTITDAAGQTKQVNGDYVCG